MVHETPRYAPKATDPPSATHHPLSGRSVENERYTQITRSVNSGPAGIGRGEGNGRASRQKIVDEDGKPVERRTFPWQLENAWLRTGDSFTFQNGKAGEVRSVFRSEEDDLFIVTVHEWSS
jgi:hypothetical protein